MFLVFMYICLFVGSLENLQEIETEKCYSIHIGVFHFYLELELINDLYLSEHQCLG